MWLVAIEKTHDADTVDSYTTYARRYVQFFGSALVNVTVARMGDYQRAALGRVARRSVQKERSAMNTFLAWCFEQGILAEEHIPKWPMLPKRAVGTPTGKGRPAAVDITAEQARAFVLALPLVSLRARHGRRFPVRARFVLMAETGLRPATLDALEVPKHWRPGQADLAITADIDKARAARKLPLTTRAIAALEAAHELNGGAEGLIFGEHDYRTVVERARLAAELPEDFVPYDLRHHFVSFMADAAEARATMHLAGHTRLTTTNHYVRGQEDRAREALSALGSRGILGEGEVPMRSAKEGSRTLTGVTPPEPESGGEWQDADNHAGVEGLGGTENPSKGQVSGDSPEMVRAQFFLTRLRSEWDALEQMLAGELLGGES